jgi:hypothetical protein
MQDSTAQEGVYLSAGELSEVLAIGDVEISRLARRGVLPREPDPERPRYFRYPLKVCAANYIRSLKSAGQQDRDRYWKARAKSEKEKAHALSTANAVRDGQLLEARAVEAGQRELAHTLRQRLAMIPARLADQFGENGDRDRIEQAVERELGAALSALGK